MIEEIPQELTKKAKEKLRTNNWIHVIIISGIIALILPGISIIPTILTGGLLLLIFMQIALHGLKLAGARIECYII